MNKVVIIGSGCSGLAACYSLSKSKNNKITLITADDSLGKKYLVTGNGRCNIGNINAFNKNYNCYISNNNFIPSFFNEEDQNNYYSYLKEACIDLFCDDENRLYPFSFTSSNVKKQLTDIVINKIDYILNKKVIKIDSNKKYIFLDDNTTINYDYLVIACGGLSSYNFNNLFENLNIKSHPFIPALTSIIPNFTWPKRIIGQKVKGLLKIKVNGKEYQESGEFLFKEKELSGIMIFNSSLLIKENQEIEINLAKYKSFSANYNNYLSYLPLKVAEEADELPLKNGILRFKAKVATNSKNSQVLKGGIDLSEIKLTNMSLINNKNIFIIGEALDFTGLCGGYNIMAAIIEGLRVSID